MSASGLSNVKNTVKYDYLVNSDGNLNNLFYSGGLKSQPYKRNLVAKKSKFVLD